MTPGLGLVLIDTSHWLGFVSPTDEFHAAACAWHDARLGRPSITTDWILAELLPLVTARAPAKRGICVNLIADLRRGVRGIELVTVDVGLRDAGWRLIEDRPSTPWSWTDAVSIALMRRRGLHHALTSDTGFRAAGLVPLLRERPPSRP